MKALELLTKNISNIESQLGYQFKNRELLALAFVHRSCINENREIENHNERLEFLGDSVLGVLVADYLYRFLPTTQEGELSYLKSRLVEASSCVKYIYKLDLEKYLLLGKGEKMNDGRGRESILADLFEALIGAIYLDGGLESVRVFLFNNFAEEINAILQKPLLNWKALLQDYCQKTYQTTPTYHVVEEVGPDHSKTFRISVLLNTKEVGFGEGSSKKEAQQKAAEDAVKKMNIEV